VLAKTTVWNQVICSSLARLWVYVLLLWDGGVPTWGGSVVVVQTAWAGGLSPVGGSMWFTWSWLMMMVVVVVVVGILLESCRRKRAGGPCKEKFDLRVLTGLGESATAVPQR